MKRVNYNVLIHWCNFHLFDILWLSTILWSPQFCTTSTTGCILLSWPQIMSVVPTSHLHSPSYSVSEKFNVFIFLTSQGHRLFHCYTTHSITGPFSFFCCGLWTFSEDNKQMGVRSGSGLVHREPSNLNTLLYWHNDKAGTGVSLRSGHWANWPAMRTILLGLTI